MAANNVGSYFGLEAAIVVALVASSGLGYGKQNRKQFLA